MQKNTALITQLKESGQDFEFYPTTKEMVATIYCNAKERNIDSVLDIGAGNGGFLNEFAALCKSEKEGGREITKYAIEKSDILMSRYPADIFILGTDFHQQTLIDKKVDMIFCNPPYSQYELWAARIIKEANAKHVYLIIPQRWKDNEVIKAALKKRKARHYVIGHTDFKDAERAARAVVDIIRVDLCESYRDRAEVDPFKTWFEDFFKLQADKTDDNAYARAERKADDIKNGLVKGQNLIDNLCELYGADMAKILKNYRVLETLDADIFKELNVSVEGLCESLKTKLEGTKSLYWKELFDHMDTITGRLTSGSRADLLNTLQEHTSIDFTSSNAYMVVLWAIKNANRYLDKQLVDMYLDLSDAENVSAYKSNKVFKTDDWRWNRRNERKETHYKLDYRIVKNVWKCFAQSSYEAYSYPNGLHNDCHALLNDLCTIGKNLGFSVHQNSFNFEWTPGGQRTFEYGDDSKPFMEVRAYKKGSIHIKFALEFSKALNIEAGRILGWLRNAEDASQELDIPTHEVSSYFNRNHGAKLGHDIKLLA
ncbi:hypothetical protein Emin_0968 [Elusimicrobium minutum Pei191]|uniref:DUF4942 domain-containing protein n=1 Tax=Elusimicrobium minutum (strain Pei191) TaxID=445932 RepID=B2KDC5_ELUMP|nr:DUF4942 domain-containing protein [Elusimicrobium minutum]ACC98521.1 hypothetical protein Emin_0968 [Elusimicrobium minutum Pei191]